MTRALLLLFLLAACGPQLDRVCVERVFETKTTQRMTADVTAYALDGATVELDTVAEYAYTLHTELGTTQWWHHTEPVRSVTARLVVDGNTVDELSVQFPWPSEHGEVDRVCAERAPSHDACTPPIQ